MGQKKDVLEKATKKDRKKDKRRKSCDGKREQKEKKGKQGEKEVRAQKKRERHKKGTRANALEGRICPCCSKHCPPGTSQVQQGKSPAQKASRKVSAAHASTRKHLGGDTLRRHGTLWAYVRVNPDIASSRRRTIMQCECLA